MSIVGTILGLLFMMLPFAAVVGVIAFVFIQQSKLRKAFVAKLQADPDVEPIGTGFIVSCQTRRPPFVKATMAGGGKNNPKRWDVTARCPMVGARTTLHVSREGAFGALREKLGFKDVHIGDPEFDDEYTLRGSEPDVVRGIVSDARVQAALRELLVFTPYGLDIKNERGDVYVRFSRGGLDPMEAKRAVLAVQHALHALEQNADAPARAEAMATSMSGSASGAPVGVPIGGREIR